MRTFAYWSGLALVLAGIAFACTLPLVATSAHDDPVGLRYAGYNRALTIALALLLVGLAGIVVRHRAVVHRDRLAGAAALVGAGLLLVGNVVEFWLVLAQERPVAAVAEREGVEAWAGSRAGFALYLAGLVVLALALLVLGRSVAQAGVLPRWAGAALAAVGLLLAAATALQPVSAAATAVVAVPLGLALIAVGIDLRLRTRGRAGDLY